MFELIAALIVVFLCVFLYQKGVRDGMKITRREEPKILPAPKPTDEQIEHAAKVNKGLAARMNYDPYKRQING